MKQKADVSWHSWFGWIWEFENYGSVWLEINKLCIDLVQFKFNMNWTVSLPISWIPKVVKYPYYFSVLSLGLSDSYALATPLPPSSVHFNISFFFFCFELSSSPWVSNRCPFLLLTVLGFCLFFSHDVNYYCNSFGQLFLCFVWFYDLSGEGFFWFCCWDG